MNDREKLIDILESAESAVYWNSDDRGFIEKIADHLIASGVTVQQWIPVSERLPDKKGKYLALLEYVKCTMILNFSLDFVVCDEYGFPTKEKKSCFYYYDDDWEKIEVPEVTHWMPIPEPPKGAKK